MNGQQQRKQQPLTIRAADRVTIAYQGLMLILIAFYIQRINLAPLFILFHLTVIVLLWNLPRFPVNRYWNTLRLWNPLIIIPLNFTELHYLVHTVHPTDFDPLLIRLDHALFGVHPAVWLERIQWPPLTEYFQLVYSTFYFIPIVLALLLLRKKRMMHLDFFVFIIVYGFYLSYIGYFLVPALGPRFSLHHLQTKPLTGLWLTPIIRHTLDTLENIQRDAFPSGHTEMTALTMYYAYHYHKKYFYVLGIVGTSLILSTVYLRYHYVADVLGGLLLAAFVVLTAGPLYRRLRG